MSKLVGGAARVAALLLCVAAGVCRADDITWVGGTNTNWFTAGNWSSNTVPSTDDIARIAVAANQPVISGATARVLDLSLNASTSLGINAGGTLSVTGDSVVNSGTINANGGTLNLSLASGGSNTAGTINVLNGGQFNIEGDFANQKGSAINIDNGSNLSAVTNLQNGIGASVNVSGTANLQMDFGTNDGLMRVNAGGTMTMTANTLTNTGTLSTQGSALVAKFGTLNINAAVALSNGGGTVNVLTGGVTSIQADLLTNFKGGSITVSSGGSLTASAGNLINDSGASINVSGTADLALDNLTNGSLVQSNAGGKLTLTTNTLTNAGTLQADGGTLDLKFGTGLGNSGGTISAVNGGLVNVQGDFDNAGTVRLGAGSIMTMSGKFTEDAGATAEFDLLSNSQFGGILIAGSGANNVELDGALVITLLPGFSLSSGVLTLLSDPNGTIEGNFASGLSGSLGGGITYLESISADRHSAFLTLDVPGSTSTVPEPAAWELTAAGLAGLAWRIRKEMPR